MSGSHVLFTMYKPAGFVLICLLVCEGYISLVKCNDSSGELQPPPSNGAVNILKGHMQPFGSHRSAEGSVDSVIGFLEPINFFANNVHQNQPVIFQGGAQKIPSFKLWSDDYLTKKFGQLPVSVEEGKKENRSARSLLMPFSEFLQVYEAKDLYMIQDITKPFQEDLSLPPCLQCGGFDTSLEVGVIWFSSGATKSVLHHDGLDNIHCLLDGTKIFSLIDKVYDYLVEDDYWQRQGTYSTVDVDSVDLIKHPSLAHIPWWQAHLEAGDCLYIPYRWYHTVTSHPGRNLAVNLFFAHRLWLDEEDCHDKEINPRGDYDSLANYRINSLHPETSALEKMRFDVFEVFEGESEVDIELAANMWEDFLPSELTAVFDMIDADKDMVLSWQEIYSVNIVHLITDFPFLLPDDVYDDFDESQDWESEYDAHSEDDLHQWEDYESQNEIEIHDEL